MIFYSSLYRLHSIPEHYVGFVVSIVYYKCLIDDRKKTLVDLCLKILSRSFRY